MHQVSSQILACICGRARPGGTLNENRWDWAAWDTKREGGERLRAPGAGRGVDNRVWAKHESGDPESNPRDVSVEKEDLKYTWKFALASFDFEERLNCIACIHYY